ncbi:hypothetical protein N9043_00260 [bacterium]|nr:hypothetical protein [bacterium]
MKDFCLVTFDTTDTYDEFLESVSIFNEYIEVVQVYSPREDDVVLEVDIHKYKGEIIVKTDVNSRGKYLSLYEFKHLMFERYYS